MPTVGSIDGIRIQVFADDHNPPHFHVVTAEYEVLIRIADFSVMQGTMRRSDLDKALAWAATHRQEIEDEWNRLNG